MKIPSAALALLLPAAIHAAPAQDWAKERLEKSPRHAEWISVPNGDRAIKCFVVYPEVKDKAPVVLVIHEIFGMTDWVRGVCDQLAEAGVIAIAPDLLSGEIYSGVDEAREAVSRLEAARVTSDLDAVAGYAKTIAAASGVLAVAGFCWGGGQAFDYAGANPDLDAAYVFYGPGPSDAAAVAKIACPVFGFYAGNDARVTSTLPATELAMKSAGKTFEPVMYPGAGHGFMRAGEDPAGSEANKTAREAAWRRWKELLGRL